MFRLRWTANRLFSRKFHHLLWSTVASPLTFYVAMVINLVTSVSVAIKLRDGKIAPVSNFTAIYVFDEIFLERIYDPPIKMEVCTVLDVGANTGLFALRAKQLWPDCLIVCYEPEPKNFLALEALIRVNNLKSVTPINAAVMPEHGTILLYLHPRNTGGHSTVHHRSAQAITVPTETMDDALSRIGGRCNFLKVDCEGAEESIFRSLSQETASKIDVISYEPEWSLYSVDALNQDLAKIGFATEKRGAIVMASRLPAG